MRAHLRYVTTVGFALLAVGATAPTAQAAIKLPLNSFTNPVLGDLNSLDLNQALSLLRTKPMKSGGNKAGR